MRICEYCGNSDKTVDRIRESYINRYGRTIYTGRVTAICDLCFYNAHTVIRFHETFEDITNVRSRSNASIW